MSKTKKDHRRKVAARNERVKAALRKRQMRQSIPQPSLMDQLFGMMNRREHAVAGGNFKDTTSEFNFDIIKKPSKIKSMETKKEEGKQVNMNGKAESAAVTASPEPVYKFTPESYTALDKFLKSRPLAEAKSFHVAFFRHGQKDPYYKQDAINRLVEYILQCPMEVAEPMMEMLEKGGLQQYMPLPEGGDGTQKTETDQKSEAPAATDQGKAEQPEA